MQITVLGETPFKALKSSFAVGPTQSGFTLNFAVSKDGPWSQWEEACPASECVVVSNVVPYMYFKLEGVGDDEEVEVIV